MTSLAHLPALVLLRITDYLQPEDTARLGQTCKRLHSIVPKFLVMTGEDFRIRGPHRGHWAPELYFEGPPLTRPVRKLSLSVGGWVDQGWGNRKGELFLKLVRGSATDSILAEKRALFGIAQHEEESAEVVLTETEPVVALAEPGDYYRFMRNAGGGGGHSLTVRGFRAVASLVD